MNVRKLVEFIYNKLNKFQYFDLRRRKIIRIFLFQSAVLENIFSLSHYRLVTAYYTTSPYEKRKERIRMNVVDAQRRCYEGRCPLRAERAQEEGCARHSREVTGDTRSGKRWYAVSKYQRCAALSSARIYERSRADESLETSGRSGTVWYRRWCKRNRKSLGR